MYYPQPSQEPAVQPAPVSHRREKKIIEIIDPRTGINVINDLSSSASEFHSSAPAANEV